jgi:hypothetical protein
MTAITMIVVCAALCFSAGEGLRLTPFTNAELVKVDKPNVHSNHTVFNQVSNQQNGPLDVPAQLKRIKRQTVALDFLPTASFASALTVLAFPVFDEPSNIVAILVASQATGRAPPCNS